MSAPAPAVSAELKALLRRLKLGRCTDTLPDRLALAKSRNLAHAEFLDDDESTFTVGGASSLNAEEGSQFCPQCVRVAEIERHLTVVAHGAQTVRDLLWRTLGIPIDGSRAVVDAEDPSADFRSHAASRQQQHVPMGNVVVRRCRNVADLEELYRAIGRQFGEEWDAGDRRLDEPLSRFDRDRDLMFAVVDGTRIRGGIIAFGDEIVTVRAVGIDEELRGQGHGRRLLELVEGRALVRGARTMVVGAADGARGFYDRMGYRGKRTMREKQLPPPGAVRSRLAEREAATFEELSRG